MKKICCFVLFSLAFSQVSYGQEASSSSTSSSSVGSIPSSGAAVSPSSSKASVFCSTQDVCSPDSSSATGAGANLTPSEANQASDDLSVATVAKNTTTTPPVIEQNTFSNMPSVKISQIDGGVSTIKVITNRTDGSKQIYTVKVDRQGNKETMITIIEPDGSESTKVVAQGDQQVQVGSQSRVIISEDGILVNANAVVSDSDVQPGNIDLALPDNDSVEEFEF